MSQNNQCACDPSNLVMLPVRGFGLAVDAGGLVPAPVPTPGACRERVDRDMHIYINGNLETSGDGLSPETAVKSFEDAVAALSRYDGSNQYSATFHFADLADAAATYPDINIFPNSYATFLTLTITGVSHETTMLGRIYNAEGTYLTLTNACIPFVVSSGWLSISGKVACKPRESEDAAFQANWGGHIRFLPDSEVFLNPGKYQSVIHSTTGHVLVVGSMKFHSLGSVDITKGFVRAFGNACVWLMESMDFSDCTAITGRKYYLAQQACLLSAGLTLPGSLPGVALQGSAYL